MLIDTVILALVASALALLTPFLWIFRKTAPQAMVPSELSGWPSWLERTGVAVGILAFMMAALWQVLRWIKPRADRVFDNLVDRANALEPLLKAQEARDVARAERDAALLGAVQALRLVVEQLADRVSKQSDSVHQHAEAVARLSDHMIALQREIAAAELDRRREGP
jgi:hypothetical protein